MSIIAQLLEAEEVRSPKESLSNSLPRTRNGRSAYLWVIKSRARTEDGHSAYNLWVVKSRLRTEDGTIGLFAWVIKLGSGPKMDVWPIFCRSSIPAQFEHMVGSFSRCKFMQGVNTEFFL